MTLPTFDNLIVTLEGQVATIALNRPKRANALHLPLWFELKAAFEWLDGEPTARVGLIRGGRQPLLRGHRSGPVHGPARGNSGSVPRPHGR